MNIKINLANSIEIERGGKGMKKSTVNPWLVVLGTVIVQMGLGTIYTWSLFNQPLVSKYG